MFFVYFAYDSEDGEVYSLEEYETEEGVFAAKLRFDEESSEDDAATFIVIRGERLRLSPKETVISWTLSSDEGLDNRP
jgi:hypothetical protein